MNLRTALLAFALLAGGCAQLQVSPGDATVRCASLFGDVDKAVARAGVADGGAGRIAGFPYLRVDRLLASFAAETQDVERFNAWVDRLRSLDHDAREAELANLPGVERERLQAAAATSAGLEAGLDRCAERLRSRDLSTDSQRAALRARAQVPDDYDTWKRIIGLYWITRIPFASGVRKYQAQVEALFEQPLAVLAVHGELKTYTPAPAASPRPGEVAAILERAKRNPLGIPEPLGSDADRLFALFAPAWIVDEQDDNDRIGRLVLGEDGRARVDTSRALVYRRFAHTRYRDQVLLQIVYSVWLPARPRISSTDLLGGHLDGVIWRVTLAPDGAPLVFDSIHNCGCYHQFFPTARAEVLPALDTLDEQAFVPQRLPALAPGDRIAVRFEARTHYIQRVLVNQEQRGGGYDFAADDILRSLPDLAGGYHSAFRPDGIVPGSERGERYVFWPMGIREPGAMRQWGRHATAFVGRRHFDEARLMERYFILRLN